MCVIRLNVIILRIFSSEMPGVVMLLVVSAEFSDAESCHAESHHAECSYVQCRGAPRLSKGV